MTDYLKNFPKFFEADGTEYRFLPMPLEEDECDVYALKIGEDVYIGSSSHVKYRIFNHYRDLIAENHWPKIQEAFDRCGTIEAYLLFRCTGNEKIAEAMFIRILQPSLNSQMMVNYDRHNMLLWKPVEPEVINHRQMDLMAGDRYLMEGDKSVSDVSGSTEQHVIGVRLYPSSFISCIHMELMDIEHGIYSKEKLRYAPSADCQTYDDFVRQQTDLYMQRLSEGQYLVADHDPQPIRILSIERHGEPRPAKVYNPKRRNRKKNRSEEQL